MQPRSKIQEFYNGLSVFITGATGFIGKVLVEKLLRSCDGIDKIYLLIRPKKGQTSEQRLETLINSQLFTFALDINKVRHKLVVIGGDLSLHRLGLKESDHRVLTENVSVIFHVAGDVNLKETMRDAVTHNLIGTKHIMNLCKECKNLDVLVHVSTAYAFCQKSELKEKIYATKVKPQEVIEAVETMNDNQLEIYTKPLLEGRPNNYTFAKALAEHIVLVEKPENLPVAIVRPSTVLASYEEPVPGWINNINGPTGVAILYCLGIMRISDYDPKVRMSFIPVDMTSNALIASAWHLATTRPKDIQIYHLASEPHNTPPLINLPKTFSLAQIDSPSNKTVRPLAGLPKTRPSRLRLWLTVLISHYLFAYFVDAIIWLLGYKPMLVTVTNRMHAGLEAMSFFWLKEWTFHSQNTKNLIEIVKNCSEYDWEVFKFDVSKVDWNKWYYDSWIGGRRYLLKESDNNIPKAKSRFLKVTYGYRIFLFVWYSIVAGVFYLILSKLSLIIYY